MASNPVDNMYCNVVHTVDGVRPLDGEAMTNTEQSKAIGKGVSYHLHPSEKYRDGFSLTKTIQISFKYI